MNMHNPAHPGELLREWFEGLNLPSQAVFADALEIHRVNLSKILNGRAGITADFDVRLAQVLNTTPGYWLALQAQHDLAKAMHKHRKLKLKRLVKPATKDNKTRGREAARAA